MSVFRSFSLLAATIAAFSISPAPAWAQTKVSIGTAKDTNLASPLIIAREKGYFRDAKLDVDLKYFPSGGDVIAAFVGGSVQFGSSGSTPTMHLRARPYPVKIVARVADISGAQQLIVKKDVTSLQQLYGKKIGLLRNTAPDAFFHSIVKAYGLDMSKFEVINMGPTEMLQGFVQGSVDAVVLWEPHTTRARKSGNGKILVSATHSFLEGKPVAKRVYGDHSTLFTSESYIKENGATVRAVLTALVRAMEFMEKNKKETIAILSKEFGLPEADISEIVGVNRYTAQLDEQMAADLDHLAEFLHKLGRIKVAPKAREWIDPAPLRAVRADLVKLK